MHPIFLFGLVAGGVAALTWAPEVLPGGRSSGVPRSRFDRRALAQGRRIEMEHTDDRAMAEEIAADHLEEFHVEGYPDEYYEELEKMERRLARRKEKRLRARRAGR